RTRSPSTFSLPFPTSRGGIRLALSRRGPLSERCTHSREPDMNRGKGLSFAVLAVGLFGISGVIQADSFRATDPGVRGGPPGAGGRIAGLTTEESEMFTTGLTEFVEEEGVPDGVGPRFNFVSCGGCHSQPAIGGTSPAQNPLFRVPGDLGFAGNTVPSFIVP